MTAEGPRVESAVLFKDLRASLEILKRPALRSIEARREFRTFVSLLATLYDVMRREHRQLGLGRLPLPHLEEWSPITDLFRDLRDLTQHQLTATLKAEERLTFDISSALGGRGRRLSVIAESSEIGPLTDDTEGKIELAVADPSRGPHAARSLPLVRRVLTYRLVAPTQEVAPKLSRLPSNDIEALCNQCFSTVEHYYRQYQQLIKDADLSKLTPPSGAKRRRSRAGRGKG